MPCYHYYDGAHDTKRMVSFDKILSLPHNVPELIYSSQGDVNGCVPILFLFPCFACCWRSLMQKQQRVLSRTYSPHIPRPRHRTAS